MELKHLEAFQVIVTTGSFSIAADQLNVTQSALSHQIKNLELEIGQKLLTRARPNVYPTEAGRTLLTSVSRILGEMQSVKAHFGISSETRPIGALHIASTYSGLTYLYGDFCEEFIKRYPEVEFSFTATHAADEAVMRVVGKTADIAFGPFPVSAPGLDTVLLGAIEQVFVVGRGHALCGAGKVAVAELTRFPFVRFQARTGSRALSDQVFKPHGSYPPILMESNNTEFMKRLVARGMGIALMPAFAVADELRAGSLHALRLASGRLMQEVGFCYPSGAMPRTVELFKACCLELRGQKLWEMTLESILGKGRKRPQSAESKQKGRRP